MCVCVLFCIYPCVLACVCLCVWSYGVYARVGVYALFVSTCNKTYLSSVRYNKQ